MSIFNKRSQEEPPHTATGGGSGVESDRASEKNEVTPLSSMPFKTQEPDGARRPARIGKAVKISGQIYSEEELYVDGDVEGTIELREHRLTIGPNGRVHSTVIARDVVILGNLEGNVDTRDKLEVRKDARVVGDIKTARIVIEDGAYFKGSIDMVKPEPTKSSVSLRPEPYVMLAATVGNS